MRSMIVASAAVALCLTTPAAFAASQHRHPQAVQQPVDQGYTATAPSGQFNGDGTVTTEQSTVNPTFTNDGFLPAEKGSSMYSHAQGTMGTP